ncbi:MAG: MoaD/ThiS family protein [Thermodesulfobacterium sp.]|nr:MoaD/ThiS family protein [Thermodesulfobacterium sp.]
MIDVLNRLGIKLEEVAIILVNGMNVEPEYILKDGDYISLFPPVGGG